MDLRQINLNEGCLKSGLPPGNSTAVESNPTINTSLLRWDGLDRIEASFLTATIFGEGFGQGITLAVLKGISTPLQNFQQCEYCHFISLVFC